MSSLRRLYKEWYSKEMIKSIWGKDKDGIESILEGLNNTRLSKYLPEDTVGITEIWYIYTDIICLLFRYE